MMEYPTMGPYGMPGPWSKPAQPPMGAPGPMSWPTQGQMSIPAPTLNEVLSLLLQAYNELSLQCATTSVGHFIPEVKRLPGFKKLHEENYEIAYHMTTAIGVARKLLNGAREPGYLSLLVSCQRESRSHQRKAQDAYQKMAEAAPQSVRPLIQEIGSHLQATSRYLQQAIALTNSALGQEMIERLMRMAREALGEE